MSVTQRKGFVKYKDFTPMHYKSRPKKNNLLRRATLEYTTIIEKRNIEFKRELLFIPKRTLTNPREPSKNDGFDNIHDDYILRVNDYLGIENQYQILDLMGQGTFGQVVKCKLVSTKKLVAIKVIKKHPAFLYQGDKEIQILLKLKNRPKDKDKFLQILDSFSFRGHTCAVLELLSISLHKLFNQVEFNITDIKKISLHILQTLNLLKEMRIIHTDLKPDNILIKSLDDIHNVKLIDYGSAFMETDKLNYRVQTAFYRSPEVILHVPFNCAIDMWSFGCFVAEMYFGEPLFSSGNELTLLHMMTSLLRSFPSDHMLKQGKRTKEFFKSDTESKEIVGGSHDTSISKDTLEDKIMGYKGSNEEKQCLFDFLSKILVFDPDIRFTPKEALQHPFITGNNIDSVPSPISGILMNNSSSTSRTDDSVETPLDISIKSPTKSSTHTSPTAVSPPKVLKSILKKTDYQFVPAQQENTLDRKIATFYPMQRPGSIVPMNALEYQMYRNTISPNLQDPSLVYQQDPLMTYQQDPSLVYQQDPSLAYQQDPSLAYQQDPSLAYQQDRILSYQPVVNNNPGYYVDPFISKSPYTQHYNRANKQFGNRM